MAGIELTDFIAVNYVKSDRDSYVHFLTEIDFNCTDYKQIISSGATVIFTSKFNAWYLKNVLKFTAASLHGVDVGKSYPMNYNGRHFSFCFFYSKSSTGSVALLLNGDFGVYLYTGNFCYYNGITATICPEMKKIISTQSLSRLYFDATYYEQKSDFMGYDELIDKISKIIIDGLYQRVYIIVDKVGQEGLLIDVLLHVQGKIPDVLFHVNQERFDMLSVLGYDHLFTTDEKNARIYVRSSSFLKKKHQDEAYDLIFIKRTSEICQNFKSYQVINGWHMFTFYTHSSHERCCNMINLFKPESLIPTSLTVDKCGIKFKDFTKDESFSINEVQEKRRKVSSTCLPRPSSSKRKDTVLKNVTKNKSEDASNRTRKTLNNGSFISKKKKSNDAVSALDTQTNSSKVTEQLNSAKSSENAGNKFVKTVTQDEVSRKNICNNNLLNKTLISSKNITHMFQNSSIDAKCDNLALIEKLKERDQSVYVKLSYNVQKNLFKQLLISEVNSKKNVFKFNSKNKSKSIYPAVKIRLLLNPKIIRKLFLYSVKNGKVSLKPSIDCATTRMRTTSFFRNNLNQITENRSNKNLLKENEKVSLVNENKLLNIHNIGIPFKPVIQACVKENYTLQKSSSCVQSPNVLKVNSKDCLFQRCASSVTLNNDTSIVERDSKIENDQSTLVMGCRMISNESNFDSISTETFENDNLKNNPLIANISTIEKNNKTSFHSDIVSSDTSQEVLESGSPISQTTFSVDKLTLASKILQGSSISEQLQNVSESIVSLETNSKEKVTTFAFSEKMKGEHYYSNVENIKNLHEKNKLGGRNFEPNGSLDEQNSGLDITNNEFGWKSDAAEKQVEELSYGNAIFKVRGLLKVKLDRNMEESSDYFYSKNQHCYFPLNEDTESFNGFDCRLVQQNVVNYKRFIKFLLRISKLKKYRRRNETW